MLTYIFVIRRSLTMASSIFLSTGGTPCLLTLQLTTCISRKRHARHMPMFGLQPSLAGVPTELEARANENHPCGSGTPYRAHKTSTSEVSSPRGSRRSCHILPSMPALRHIRDSMVGMSSYLYMANT